MSGDYIYLVFASDERNDNILHLTSVCDSLEQATKEMTMLRKCREGVTGLSYMLKKVKRGFGLYMPLTYDGVIDYHETDEDIWVTTG